MDTPNSATLAKFLSEISDFSLAMTNDYVKRNTDTIINGDRLTDAQVYYWIASGKENIGEDEEAVPTGTVDSLELNFITGDLNGSEYYEITDDKNITNWKNNKKYFSENEKHYVTDEGEVFILPGYLVMEENENRWWVNDQLYYVGEGVTIQDEVDN